MKLPVEMNVARQENALCGNEKRAQFSIMKRACKFLTFKNMRIVDMRVPYDL
jgi:hypothetical protein